MHTLDLIDALIGKLRQARDVARNDAFFESYIGAECVRAMYALTEVDGLYALAAEIERNAGGEFDPRDMRRVVEWNFVFPGFGA